MKTMGHHRRGRTNSRERLLEAAARLFRTKGFSATGIRAIAAQLGIRNASLYHYIHTKDELLSEIAQQAIEELEAKVKPIALSELPPAEKLRRFIEQHVTAILQERDKHAVMLTQLSALPASRRKAIIELRDRYEDLVARVILEAQEAQVIRRDVPVRYLKLALLNLLNWSIFWYKPGGSLTPSAIGEMLASMFLEGAIPRSIQ